MPKASPIRISEKAFLQQIRDLSRLCGWLCYHTHDSRRSEPGFPDIVLARGDRILFAELKAEKGKTTPAQDLWLSALRASGKVEVYLWRPSDWEGIVKCLKGKTGAPATTRPSRFHTSTTQLQAK